MNQEEFNLFAQKKTIDYKKYSAEEKRPYGIYHNDKFYTRIDIRDKMNVELVLHLQVFSETELIVTYIENSVKKSCIYDIENNQIIKELKDTKGNYLYKPCCYENDWFSVITLLGDNIENRYVIPVKLKE